MPDRTILLGALTSVVLFAAAPAAHAQGVTNPADHPAPVKVTIDGRTYSDGLDTLPGYDDQECTPIPGVQYDFAQNEIQYYNNEGELLDTAHWTEWSRISSYETWQAQQNAGTPTSTPTPTPSATSQSTATPAPTSAATTTTSPAASSPAASSPTTSSPTTTTTKRSTTKPSSGTKSTHSSATTESPKGSTTSSTTSSSPGTSTSTAKSSDTTTSSPTATATATAGAATAGAGTETVATDPAATTGSTVTVASNATPDPGAGGATTTSNQQTPTANFKLASQQFETGADPADTRLAGVGILVALFGVAGLGLVFRGIARLQGLSRQ